MDMLSTHLAQHRQRRKLCKSEAEKGRCVGSGGNAASPTQASHILCSHKECGGDGDLDFSKKMPWVHSEGLAGWEVSGVVSGPGICTWL